MAKKDDQAKKATKDNPIQAAEKQAEKDAEATRDPTDEEVVAAEAAEQGSGTKEEIPAEVAAINTDNETVKEAGASTEERKDVKSEVVQDRATETEENSTLAAKSEPTGRFADIIKQIEELKVTELAELVKALEERFGVSAMAPVAVGASGGQSASAEATAGKEEKSLYNVVLAEAGAQKIAVIKAVREVRQDLGLKEAKDLVDGAPKELLKDAKKEEAEAAKAKLEAAGAKVELK